MTILSGRWDIDYVAKRVFRLVAVQPTVTDSTLALYSALQDEFDEPAQMDDQVPMSAQTPTAFTMINGWFMDDVSTQFLTGGALTTTGWAGNIIGSKSFDATGGVSLQASDIGLLLTGTTTSETGTILGFDERFGTDLGVIYLRPTVPATDTFDNDTEAWTVGGSSAAGIFSNTYQAGVLRTGESLWPNIFALGTLVDETELYVIQNQVKLAAWWPKGFIDILVRTTEQGTETDNGFIMVGARQFGALYDHFIIDVSAGGRQPVPLSTGNDGNNVDGHRQMVHTDSAGTFAVGDIIEDDADQLTRVGLVTSVSGTNPTVTLQYIVLGDLSDFNTGAFPGSGRSPSTGSWTTTPALTSVNQANLGTPPTLIVGADDISLGAGEPLAPYSLVWDTNQNTMTDFYGYLKLVTKRGAGVGGVIETDFTAQAGTETITGEQYIGNELQVQYGTQTGAFVEGELLFFFTSGDVLQATGVVVADHDDGATGDLIMRNMQFVGSDTIAKIADNATPDTGDFATATSTRTIAPVKTAPFGSLAGGVFFGAPGVAVIDILAAEGQNFQLIDDDGTTRNPPITISVTVTGTLSDDRVSVHELDAPFSPTSNIIKNQFTMTAAAATENGIGDSNVEADATIPNDTPASGFVMVVDDSLSATGIEHRFQYDSFSGQIFTLTPLTMTGAQLYDGGGDATGTFLEDADADFISNGVKVGHIVRNTTDTDSYGVVVLVTSSTITHTPLVGGSGEWDASDAYEINTIPVDFTTSDEAYVPIILDETGGTSIVSADMTYIGDRDIMIRVRNGGSANPITPFETGATLGNTVLGIAAIRTPDGIAT